jgi:hypothetical protein
VGTCRRFLSNAESIAGGESRFSPSPDSAPHPNSMKTTQRNRVIDFVSLAVILAMLLMGVAIVAWEWRKAHYVAPRHAPQAAHHSRSQRNPPGVTPLEKHQ